MPSVDNQPYTIRLVDPAGNLLTDFFGEDLGGIIAGSGNPGDAGVGYGVEIQITKTAKDNSYATVRVTPAH